MARLDILNKENSKNVFTYYDLAGKLNTDLESVIQDLKKFKGFLQESDKKDLDTIRNYLIKSQKKFNKLKTRLYKSKSWFMRK